MPELMFVRFHEYNDNEGESWDFWLQLTGNEAEMAKLDRLVSESADDEYYSLRMSDVEPESVVDKLVQYAESGYMGAHNKVKGVLTCPDDLGEDADDLYKGGVEALFAPAKEIEENS